MKIIVTGGAGFIGSNFVQHTEDLRQTGVHLLTDPEISVYLQVSK